MLLVSPDSKHRHCRLAAATVLASGTVVRAAALTAADYWLDEILLHVESAKPSFSALFAWWGPMTLGTHHHCWHPREHSPFWASVVLTYRQTLGAECERLGLIPLPFAPLQSPAQPS